MVIRNRKGEEQVLQCGELYRCCDNPHRKRDDPSVSKAYHKWNRQQVKRIHVGTTVKYKCDDEWVTTKVLRVIRGANAQDIVYTVPKTRLINALSVKLTARVARRARKQNKLWYPTRTSTRTRTRSHAHTHTYTKADPHEQSDGGSDGA